MTTPAYREDVQEESWLDILHAMSDEELGDFALDNDKNLRKFRELANMAAGELLRRRPEGARVHAFGDTLVTYNDSWEPYEYDLPALERIFRKMISKTEWDSMVEDETIPAQHVTRVLTTTATAIAKAHGTMAMQALESCRTRRAKDTRLSFQAIPEVERE